MRSIRNVLVAIGLVALLAILIVVFGGVMLNRNLDTVADAAVEASGIREQMAKAGDERCRLARERFETLWNEAVDSDTFEAREKVLTQAEGAMKATCTAE